MCVVVGTNILERLRHTHALPVTGFAIERRQLPTFQHPECPAAGMHLSQGTHVFQQVRRNDDWEERGRDVDECAERDAYVVTSACFALYGHAIVHLPAIPFYSLLKVQPRPSHTHQNRLDLPLYETREELEGYLTLVINMEITGFTID